AVLGRAGPPAEPLQLQPLGEPRPPKSATSSLKPYFFLAVGFLAAFLPVVFFAAFFVAAFSEAFLAPSFFPKIASYPSANFPSSANPCRTMLTVVPHVV